MPLFAVIAALALLGFYSSDIDLSVVAIELYRMVDNPVLVAIPLFTFTGFLLSESRASHRLVRLTEAFLGWLPGGLAIVALFACAIFTALTGASGVTIIAIGALLYPALKEGGYQERFSLGLLTSSGSLGLLFPPSIVLIIYGVIAQQLNLGQPISIDDMFLAGLLPGLLMLAMLSLYGIWAGWHVPRRRMAFSWGEALGALREAIWELPLPVIVLGGIYSGLFAASEAAAVSVLYVLIIEVLVYREIPLRDLPRIMRESMVVVGGVLIILGVALASTNWLIDAEVPMHLFEWVRAHVDDRLTFLLLLNIALVLIVPLILPIAVAFGIHPVHLGIVFLANMQIGYFTPPVGMNLFIASYRFQRSLAELVAASLPYFFILLGSVLIITYWPALSLFLIKGP
ncbi:MAG: C4-dicarboxylate ABC transporter [Acidithiobacillales bacterium SM23_46]|nr:MAG: C4-dicarboxylate ABC transporter [Acidithiobacillales bacterium SM23_46]